MTPSSSMPERTFLAVLVLGASWLATAMTGCREAASHASAEPSPLPVAACFAARIGATKRSGTNGSTQGGFELDELVPQRGPVVPEQSQRLILNTLPHPVGAIVRGNALGGETRMALAPVVVLGEVDETVANERLDVSTDRRGIGSNCVCQVSEWHASCHPKRCEDRPLGAPDAGFLERVVVGSGEGAAGSTHTSTDAAHRRHDVDLERLTHNFRIHAFSELARHC